MARGRPRGRALTGPELQQLRELLDARTGAERDARAYAEQLEDLVLSYRESGASVRVIAAQLGVGSTTVQNWIRNARRRRG